MSAQTCQVQMKSQLPGTQSCFQQFRVQHQWKSREIQIYFSICYQIIKGLNEIKNSNNTTFSQLISVRAPMKYFCLFKEQFLKCNHHRKMKPLMNHETHRQQIPQLLKNEDLARVFLQKHR